MRGTGVRALGTRRRLPVLLAMAIGLAASCAGTSGSASTATTSPRTTASGSPPSTVSATELAAQVQTAMSSLTSTTLENHVAHVVGSPCRLGPDRYVVSRSADGTRGSVDVGGDGSVDAVRAGDQVYVSAALVPTWGVPTPWIALPTAAKDPVAALALRTKPIATVGALIDPAPLSDVILQARVLGSGTGTRVGTEPVAGTSTTRFDFTEDQLPDGGSGATISVWVDDQDVLRRFSMTAPGQDPRGLVTLTGELRATDQPVDVALPAPSDATPFAELPAGPVARDSKYLDPACSEDAAGAEAQRTCVVDAANQKTVADLARERLSAPFGCSSPA